MSLVLYRKYRPCDLNEVIAQEHITETLAAALEKERVGHAFLFTGPRGVGKTSVARLLAYALNGLSYKPDDQEVDIIEIDAASNGHVEDIRELRATINIVPAKLSYKVYIIDEAHMISHGAVNALLKTLEEPPAHVVFILATTEVHRIPATIVSRCQRFAFRPIPAKALSDHLQTICQKEKIKVDKDALDLIAQHSQGSLRDGLSILEQLASLTTKVTLQKTQQILGLPEAEAVKSLINAYRSQDIVALSEKFKELIYQGTNPVILVDQLGDYLRENLNQSPQVDQDIDFLQDLLDIHTARRPEALLEAVLLKHTKPPAAKASPPPTTTQPSTQSQPQVPKEQTAAREEKPDNLTKRNLTVGDWPNVIAKFKEQNPLIKGFSNSQIDPSKDTVKIMLDPQTPNIHAKQAQTPETLADLSQTISQLGLKAGQLVVEASQADSEPPAETQETKANSKQLESVLGVFEGAEVVDG